MKPKISEAAFAVLVEQTGLPLTAQQRATLYEAYPMVEAMVARVTQPLPREAEPALVFTAEVR
ncbi:MAG: hypothetical protein JO267_01555 [Alphaproteobacteria bacterium]|nr:hypothetical protein [Alphaproteobacteria bacterium]MBV9860812.1 hypothetical protein [Alphaproteobacteria bacterium]